ncbi:MAG: hypothetical protein WB609_14010 [Candidatus Cybelea sp.]
MGRVAFDGRLYAVGGRIDTPAHNTSLPEPRSGMAVVEYQARILAIGGEQAGMSTSFATNYSYDPFKNRWSEAAPLPEGRRGTGAVVLGGRLLLPGGASIRGGSRQSNTTFVYVAIARVTTY